MTGILVALLVIVTAALCFLLGMIVGVTVVDEAEVKGRRKNERIGGEVNESRF